MQPRELFLFYEALKFHPVNGHVGLGPLESNYAQGLDMSSQRNGCVEPVDSGHISFFRVLVGKALDQEHPFYHLVERARSFLRKTLRLLMVAEQKIQSESGR